MPAPAYVSSTTLRNGFAMKNKYYMLPHLASIELEILHMLEF